MMQSFSEIIAREQAAIMTRWLDQARRAASARGLDEPALVNIMPRYLASLAAGQEGSEYVERHLAARLRQGFQLAEIVDEFALLGRCIVERSFAIAAADQPDAAEIDRLYGTLQRASAAVISMFDQHMREDEQLEKRYTRQLRDIATAALQGGGVQPGLHALLQLVKEAMGAQGAVLLLRDPEAHLMTVATAGAEPLEDYAAKIGEDGSGALAPSEPPSGLWEVSADQLEVPSMLRASGIHAILAVQLSSHSGLFGVIYVGVAEERAFAARESRRLEALAEQLVAHLDTLMLLERFAATIASLRTEKSIREHFVSVLAHDLRGPLAGAKLGADLLSQQPESLDVRRELAVRIDRNLERLDQMIRDLLDANRIRAGERLPLRLDTCDLRQIANEVAEELRVLHGDRFEVQGDHHASGIWSADELRRALWNLGANAVKYGAPDRPITLIVRQRDGRVRMSVHNWGAPISPDDQAQIFEPFARTRDAVDAGRPGWGLGLTLVRGCAQAHGGSVSVSSSEAEGTTFTIEMPVDARPYQADAAAVADAWAGSVH